MLLVSRYWKPIPSNLGLILSLLKLKPTMNWWLLIAERSQLQMTAPMSRPNPSTSLGMSR